MMFKWRLSYNLHIVYESHLVDLLLSTDIFWEAPSHFPGNTTVASNPGLQESYYGKWEPN